MTRGKISLSKQYKHCHHALLMIFIREGSKTIEENTNFRYPGNWHKYFIGFAFIIFLLGVEYILIMGTSQYVFANNSNSNLNVKSNKINFHPLVNTSTITLKTSDFIEFMVENKKKITIFSLESNKITKVIQ